MNVENKILEYISSQKESKALELHQLHNEILGLAPNCKQWFLDGKDASGKVITNPNIGYATQTLKYTDGSSREFYRIGISGNTTGISVYIMGIEDKNYLKEHFAETIGKATVTGYCIKFRSLKDIDLSVLKKAIAFGLNI